MKCWLLLLPLSLACSAHVEQGPEEEKAPAPVESPKEGEPQDEPAPAPAPDECTEEGATSECVLDGEPGARECEVTVEGLRWGSCHVIPTLGNECQEGDSYECFPPGDPWREEFGDLRATCRLIGGRWAYNPSDCATPLVLSFDDRPVEFTRAAGAFDLFGQAMSIGTDWVSASTPWLVLDRDGDGLIADGSELFGSMTPLPDGGRARDGFSALASLDSDRDRRITAGDAAFSELRLWSDSDQDRRSSPAELRSLASAGIEVIELEHQVVPRCTPSGCERERSSFSFRDRDGKAKSGAVIDVHLRGF